MVHFRLSVCTFHIVFIIILCIFSAIHEFDLYVLIYFMRVCQVLSPFQLLLSSKNQDLKTNPIDS
jgi:hypothetical protein